MYLFGFSLPITTNTLPKEIFIPCNFCQVRTQKFPIASRPESSFPPHQLSIHYQIEGIHYHQHSGTHPLAPFFPNANHPNHVQSTSSFFFPVPAQIWRTLLNFCDTVLLTPLQWCTQVVVAPNLMTSDVNNSK